MPSGAAPCRRRAGTRSRSRRAERPGAVASHYQAHRFACCYHLLGDLSMTIPPMARQKSPDLVERVAVSAVAGLQHASLQGGVVVDGVATALRCRDRKQFRSRRLQHHVVHCVHHGGVGVGRRRYDASRLVGLLFVGIFVARRRVFGVRREGMKSKGGAQFDGPASSIHPRNGFANKINAGAGMELLALAGSAGSDQSRNAWHGGGVGRIRRSTLDGTAEGSPISLACEGGSRTVVPHLPSGWVEPRCLIAYECIASDGIASAAAGSYRVLSSSGRPHGPAGSHLGPSWGP